MQKWNTASIVVSVITGLGLVRDFWGWQGMITEAFPVVAPFLKIFGVAIGGGLLVGGIAWAIESWQKHKGEKEKKKLEKEREEAEERRKDSPQWRFTRVETLANRLERGEATTEEEQEYYERLTSFWGQGFFSGIDTDNYEEVRKRARYWAKKLF